MHRKNYKNGRLIGLCRMSSLFVPTGFFRGCFFLPPSVKYPQSIRLIFFFHQEYTKQGDGMELIKIICAILLPPVGVFLQVGIGKHFWINIILTLLGYIPGIVHAVWVIAKKK